MKKANNRVQGTLHKVSGPLTRDVHRETMKYLTIIWILILAVNSAWSSPVISNSFNDIDSSTEHYGESQQDVMMRCQISMREFTNMVQHIASTNIQMRTFLQSIYAPMPARIDYYYNGILEPRSYTLVWPRQLHEKRPPSTVPHKFSVSLHSHQPHTESDDEFFRQVGWCLLYDLTNSVYILFINGKEEESLNSMLKDCILEAYREFEGYIPQMNNLKGEQAGPGYPPQGAGPPDP